MAAESKPAVMTQAEYARHRRKSRQYISQLAKAGVLEKYGVKVIGVQVDAIERGEDRQAFKDTMNRLGIEMPKSELAYSVEEAEKIAADLGYRDQLATANYASLASYYEARTHGVTFSPRLRWVASPLGIDTSLVAGVDLGSWGFGRRFAADPGESARAN